MGQAKSRLDRGKKQAKQRSDKEKVVGGAVPSFSSITVWMELQLGKRGLLLNCPMLLPRRSLHHPLGVGCSALEIAVRKAPSEDSGKGESSCTEGPSDDLKKISPSKKRCKKCQIPQCDPPLPSPAAIGCLQVPMEGCSICNM